MVFASNKSFGGSGKLETWPIYTSHKILIGAPADPGQPRRAAFKGTELARHGLATLPGSGGTGTPSPGTWEGAGKRENEEKGQQGGGMRVVWGCQVGAWGSVVVPSLVAAVAPVVSSWGN